MSDISKETTNAKTEKVEAKQKRVGFIGRLLGRNKKNELTAAHRRHIRHACSCIGTMSIVNRSLAFEGIVSEIAQGGIKFRPAKTYLQDRKGVQISIEFGGMRLTGKIVATRADGYGIALFEQVGDERIDAFLSEYGAQRAA